MDNIEKGQGSNPKKYPLKKSEPKPIQPNRRTTPIPGPAGVVMAALERRGRGKHPETESVSTQVFIDRIGTEPEYDDSFNQKPWQTALELGYMYFEGYTNFDEVRSLLPKSGTIRIPVSMGIITSSKRMDCEHGSLMLELKDHTQSKLCATIHHSTINENDFQGKFVEGAVIVLGNVVVFNPTRFGNMYFNVVAHNLLLLIDVDGVVCTPKIVSL